MLLTQDISQKDSIMKTVVFNKIINYLYLKLPDDKKANMLEMLKYGISNDFLTFMGEELDDNTFNPGKFPDLPKGMFEAITRLEDSTTSP